NSRFRLEIKRVLHFVERGRDAALLHPLMNEHQKFVLLARQHCRAPRRRRIRTNIELLYVFRKCSVSVSIELPSRGTLSEQRVSDFQILVQEEFSERSRAMLATMPDGQLAPVATSARCAACSERSSWVTWGRRLSQEPLWFTIEETMSYAASASTQPMPACSPSCALSPI